MTRISLALVLIAMMASPAMYAQQPAKEKSFHVWGDDISTAKPLNAPDGKKLPLIRVQGNRFVNAKGDTVLFRGLAISDPDNLEQIGHWNRELFAEIKSMGAMIVRIPIHPVAWRERTPGRYLELLDQAVAWCTELGIYIMIDWHSIGNLKMELFQDPMYNTTQRETYEFWQTIAHHFAGNNTVAFYELFNEPTVYNGRLGRMTWEEWKRINENIIDLIRAFDRETIPLVAGLDWAYDLTPLQNDPVRAEGIGYVTHPYPHKRPKPYEPRWEENFGFAASRYPVVATEFSFTLGRGGMADNGEYGRAIISYLEAKNISWICWVFDPKWTPRMLESWDHYRLTECGEFFKQAMHGMVGDGRH